MKIKLTFDVFGFLLMCVVFTGIILMPLLSLALVIVADVSLLLGVGFAVTGLYCYGISLRGAWQQSFIPAE